MHNNNKGNKKRIVDCKIELKPKKKEVQQTRGWKRERERGREEISPLHLVESNSETHSASDYFCEIVVDSTKKMLRRQHKTFFFEW